MADECLFCKIARREVPSQLVHEDDLCVAFKDIHPRAPVHLLVTPKEHIARLGDATPDHKELLGHLQLIVAKLAKEQGISETGYRVIINNGPDGGQEVFHIHIHLLGGAPLGTMVTPR